MEDTVLIVCNPSGRIIPLARALHSAGLRTEILPGTEDVLARIGTADLLVLELNPPLCSAFTLVDTVRQKGLDLPIMLIGRDIPLQDILYGLRIGADDYVQQPFDPILCAARIQSILRRCRGALPGCNSACILSGPFSYNTHTLRLFKDQQEIHLSSTENALFKLFISNPNRIFSREVLYDLVWGHSAVDDNAIMVYISRLRRKIEDDPAKPRYLQTVRGLGYRFMT